MVGFRCVCGLARLEVGAIVCIYTFSMLCCRGDTAFCQWTAIGDGEGGNGNWAHLPDRAQGRSWRAMASQRQPLRIGPDEGDCGTRRSAADNERDVVAGRQLWLRGQQLAGNRHQSAGRRSDCGLVVRNSLPNWLPTGSWQCQCLGLLRQRGPRWHYLPLLHTALWRLYLLTKVLGPSLWFLLQPKKSINSHRIHLAWYSSTCCSLLDYIILLYSL